MSNYASFDVKIDNGDGMETLVPAAVVKVRDVTAANPVTGVGAIALADLESDGNGHVAAGSLAIAVGRIVRFSWFRDLDGRCGSAVQVTT
jgi:hypothetical protein